MISNPNEQPGAHSGSPTLRGETGFTLQSDWSVHQLRGELHAGYTDDLKLPKASSPDGNGKFDLRLDATRNTAIDIEARGTLATQSAGSPILGSTTVSERPLVATVGGTAGVTERFGDALLGLHGTIDRTDYSNATLPDGSILALSGDSFTDYGLQTRAGYELTPGVIPFVELDADIRRRDQALDTSGFARNSSGEAAQVGTTFELTRLLTGEIAGGYAQRHYADPRLAKLHGPTFASSLVWSVTPLTTVTLKGVTTLGETTVAYASGAVTRTISLELAHQLLWNLKARRPRFLFDEYVSRRQLVRANLYGNLFGRIRSLALARAEGKRVGAAVSFDRGARGFYAEQVSGGGKAAEVRDRPPHHPSTLQPPAVLSSSDSPLTLPLPVSLRSRGEGL